MTVATGAGGATVVSAAPGRRLVLGVALDVVIGALFSLTLVAYALLGNYARYVADDYGTAIAVQFRGFWAQQVAAYRLSDGHFVATALQTALSMVNPVVVRFLPAVLLIAWVAAIALGVRHLIPAAGRLGHFLIAAGVVYATLRLTPSPFLALYWMTASVAFVVPLILAALVVWLITRPGDGNKVGAGRLLLIGVLAMVAAGEAEIYTVAAFVASTLAVLVAVVPVSDEWRAKRRQLVAAWVGSTLGFVIELASPGNALRSAAITKIVATSRPSFVDLPYFTFVRMLHFAHALVVQHWRGIVALALLAALVALRSGPAPKRTTRTGLIAVAGATGGTVLVVWAAMAPAALDYGALPPLYDQLIIVFACVCAVLILGWVAGRVARNRFDEAWARPAGGPRRRVLMSAGASLVVTAIVAAGPIATLATIHRDLPKYQAYAAGKDAQEAAAEAAHAAGRNAVTVPPLVDTEDIGIFNHTPLEELQADPTYWVNADTAEYYGIKSIAIPH